jgi:hypothetical protein
MRIGSKDDDAHCAKTRIAAINYLIEVSRSKFWRYD